MTHSWRHSWCHPQAGWHEVVVTDATLAAVDAARAAGRSLWRVSSTVFSHVASRQLLRPLGRFAELPGALESYPPTPAGRQVQQELEAISLAAAQSGGGSKGGGGGGGAGGGGGGSGSIVGGKENCAPAVAMRSGPPAVSGRSGAPSDAAAVV